MTDVPGSARQAPAAPVVSHSVSSIGRLSEPVSPDAVIWPVAPRFTAATANAADPPLPGTSTMPSWPTVAGRATMSGTAPVEADNSKVFRPEVVGATPPFAHVKANVSSVGGMGAHGVSARTKLWLAPAAMSTASLGLPVTWLVARSVVWNENCAGTFVAGAIPH